MMAAMRHPNVVGFLGVCASPPCVATEYCARGSLTDVLRGGKNNAAKAKLLDWTRRLNMVRVMQYPEFDGCVSQSCIDALINAS